MEHAALQIRGAERADVPAILQLYEAAGITGERAFTVAEAEAQLALFARYPSYRVFVALMGPRIVGTYELMVMDNLAKAGARTAIVEDVAVAPDVQGVGIGRQMMLHARQQAAASGCYKLMLSSNQKREAAHAFYERLGFTRHGYSFLVEP
jgi:GNAT superfamily N-acetyltransferase